MMNVFLLRFFCCRFCSSSHYANLSIPRCWKRFRETISKSELNISFLLLVLFVESEKNERWKYFSTKIFISIDFSRFGLILQIYFSVLNEKREKQYRSPFGKGYFPYTKLHNTTTKVAKHFCFYIAKIIMTKLLFRSPGENILQRNSHTCSAVTTELLLFIQRRIVTFSHDVNYYDLR